jgi:hypothetical protein
MHLPLLSKHPKRYTELLPIFHVRINSLSRISLLIAELIDWRDSLVIDAMMLIGTAQVPSCDALLAIQAKTSLEPRDAGWSPKSAQLTMSDLLVIRVTS